MEFKSFEEMEKYFENNLKEAIKASAGQISKQDCPICGEKTECLAREDGNLECLDGKHIIEIE